MKKAILACSVFYSEINKLIKGKDDYIVKLMPQGLHNIVDSNRMKDKLQTAIDELEDNYQPDYLILLYGLCSGGVEGLITTQATLIIPKVHDCIPLLTGDLSKERLKDNKGTYYLSRGWIDCGGDTYKQYLALINNLNYWQSRFRSYQNKNQDVILEWPEKEQYLKMNKSGYDQKTAEYISYECIKGYQKISIIDNDNLKPIHYEYSKAMYQFSNKLLLKERGSGIKYNRIKGKLDLIKKLLQFEEYPAEILEDYLLTVPPGKPLKLQKELLQY